MDFGDWLVFVVSFFGLFTSIFFLLTLWENRRSIQTPRLKTYPSVTVMIPAYNEQDTIADTIRSVLRLEYPKDKLHIIVIDDGSRDNTYKIASKFASNQVLVLRKKNGGKGSALNLALKHCKTDIVGALDADSFVDKYALKRLMPYFENPSVAAVTPSMKIHRPRSVWQRIQMIEYMFGVLLRKIFSFLGSIHVTPGPFSFYRKSFFDKYGGYDEDNLTEDIEVALRIQDKGFEIENSVDAYVYTVGPSDFRTLLKQRVRWYKGFLDNVWVYRRLFSHKHGNLGVFVLPCAFLSVFLLVVSIFYATYMLGHELWKRFVYAQAVHWDIFKMKWTTDLFFIDVSPTAILAMITFVFGIGIILLARWISKEREKIVYSYAAYVFAYWFLFGFWWMMAVYNKASGRRVSWGHKSGSKRQGT